MTDVELAEIRARCEAATPGPWRRTGSFPGCGIEAPGKVGATLIAFGDSDYEAGNYEADCHPGPPFGINTEADAEFCAHARSDIPRLLAEIERLREFVGRSVSDYCPHGDGCPDASNQCQSCEARRLTGLPPLEPL